MPLRLLLGCYFLATVQYPESAQVSFCRSNAVAQALGCAVLKTQQVCWFIVSIDLIGILLIGILTF